MGEEANQSQKKQFPWLVVILIGAGCLVFALVIVGILAALLLPALAQARQASKRVDCKNNLKQMGIYLFTYVSRHGGDVHYPPAPGEGFWETLWTVPNGQSVVRRPSENSLFLCKSYGQTQRRSAQALDYTHPNFENGQLFPGGSLTERVEANVPIGGDILGMDPNHGLGESYNVLYFDGHVQMAVPGAGDDQRYQDATTGERVP